ncbi:MAG: hypothetical protein O7G83_07290 [Proteobacteria bacterium]|nr:hypothetical protein [Pseudomonadota bacterium]
MAVGIIIVIRYMNRLKKKKEPTPAAATTKDCPHCLSGIPIKAARGAHCTAELEVA